MTSLERASGNDNTPQIGRRTMIFAGLAGLAGLPLIGSSQQDHEPAQEQPEDVSLLDQTITMTLTDGSLANISAVLRDGVVTLLVNGRRFRAVSTVFGIPEITGFTANTRTRIITVTTRDFGHASSSEENLREPLSTLATTNHMRPPVKIKATYVPPPCSMAETAHAIYMLKFVDKADENYDVDFERVIDPITLASHP